MGEATTKTKTKRRSRKRCPHCGELFWPNPRTPKQQTCSAVECQKKRRRETQRHWRSKNPADAGGRRYRREIDDARERRASPTPGHPPDFPWEDVKDVNPPEVYVTIKYLVRSWIRLAKDLMEIQSVKIKADIGASSRAAAKDSIGVGGAPG